MFFMLLLAFLVSLASETHATNTNVDRFQYPISTGVGWTVSLARLTCLLVIDASVNSLESFHTVGVVSCFCSESAFMSFGVLVNHSASF